MMTFSLVSELFCKAESWREQCGEATELLMLHSDLTKKQLTKQLAHYQFRPC